MMMESGYQIFKLDSRFKKAFVSAGLHNWFPTLEEATKRKTALDLTWNKHGVTYIIVDLNGRE